MKSQNDVPKVVTQSCRSVRPLTEVPWCPKTPFQGLERLELVTKVKDF